MATFLSMRWIEPILALILAVLVGVVFANVIGRYWLGYGLTWADEIARFLFVWLTFLGATVGLARGAHVGMDMLTKALPRAAERGLSLVVLALMLLFLAVLLWQSLELVQRSMTFRTPALGLPRGMIYVVAPVSAALMSLACLHQGWKILREGRGGDA